MNSKQLLKWYIKEDVATFTELFGKNRSLLFIFTIFIFSFSFGIGIDLLPITEEMGFLFFITFILALGFQTGAVGFESENFIDNLEEETTRLISTTKMFPINTYTAKKLFVLKDGLFYTTVIILPLVVGLFIGYTVLTGDLTTLFNIPIVFFSSIFIFSFGGLSGVAVTTSLKRITIPRIAFALTIVLSNIFILIQMYSVERNIHILLIIASILAVSGILLGTIKYLFIRDISQNIQTYKNQYNSTLIGEEHYIFKRTILCIKRSSGGLVKILFPVALISIISVIMIELLLEIFPEEAMIPQFIFAGILSISAYPLYVVLFQTDSIATYSKKYPISEGTVYLQKFLVHIVFTLFVTVPAYVLLSSLYITQAVNTVHWIIGIGAVITYSIFIYLLSSEFAEDKPYELLFDGERFSIFSVVLLVLLFPFILVGIVGGEISNAAVVSSLCIMLILFVSLYIFELRFRS